MLKLEENTERQQYEESESDYVQVQKPTPAGDPGKKNVEPCETYVSDQSTRKEA